MEENKIVKYEGGELQKVKNAIEITNKLLNTDVTKLDDRSSDEESAHVDPEIESDIKINNGLPNSFKRQKQIDRNHLRNAVKQLRDLGISDEDIKESLIELGHTDGEIEKIMRINGLKDEE